MLDSIFYIDVISLKFFFLRYSSVLLQVSILIDALIEQQIIGNMYRFCRKKL